MVVFRTKWMNTSQGAYSIERPSNFCIEPFFPQKKMRIFSALNCVMQKMQFVGVGSHQT